MMSHANVQIMLSCPCILLFAFHIIHFCSLERSLSIRNEAFSLQVKSFSQDFTSRQGSYFLSNAKSS